MLVTIAGCGALGGLLAAYMVKGGLRVQVFQRKGKTLEAIEEKGITLTADTSGKGHTLYPEAVSSETSRLSPSELILVLVKSYATSEMAPLKDLLCPGGVVLTIQNGLGNAEKLASIFGEDSVAAGITTYGGVSLSPGVVKEGLRGSITYGPWSGSDGKDMGWIADLLSGAGLCINMVEDPRPLIWKKLTMNVMANPTFALTRMTPPEMCRSDFCLDLMRKIGSEAVQAAKRAGVELDLDEMWGFFMENLKKAPDHKPSMLQDMEAGRKMEIESIAGEILKYAHNKGDFPHIRTVYSLLKAIDANRGNS